MQIKENLNNDQKDNAELDNAVDEKNENLK